MTEETRAFPAVATAVRTYASGTGSILLDVYVFYYHLGTGELRFIRHPSGLPDAPINTRQGLGTVRNDNSVVIKIEQFNGTGCPLAAACNETGRIWVFYTDAFAVIQEVYSDDGGVSWTGGVLGNLSLHAGPVTLLSAVYDPAASMVRLVFEDPYNQVLTEYYWDGGHWTKNSIA